MVFCMLPPILWLVANVWIRIEKGTLIMPQNGTDDAAGLIVAFTFGTIGAILHQFRNRLFPRLTFLIGQETRRHKTLDKVQWGVVVSFAVSFVASIVTFFLT